MPMTKASIQRAENRAFFEKIYTMRELYRIVQSTADREGSPFADDLPMEKKGPIVQYDERDPRSRSNGGT